MGWLGIANFNLSNMDITLKTQQKCLTFFLCVVHNHIEGTVFQIFFLGP